MNVLITGASMGIGLELAKRCANDKHNLILVARSEMRLEALATELRQAYGIQVWVVALDLTAPDAAKSIYTKLTSAGITVDYLINNAGFGGYGEFAQSDLQENVDMVQVNITALMALTRLFLPGMIERKQGRVLNVASTAAFLPGPIMSVYYATKAFVVSFTQAIANELQGTGVTVSVLCPGPTVTEFAERAKMQGSRLMGGKLMRVMDAASVARIGYEGMLKGQVIVVPGLMNKFTVVSTRFTPRKLLTAVSRATIDRG